MCERDRLVLLQVGAVVCILGFFAVNIDVLVTQPPIVSPLEHIVGPLRAAASLPVDKAASAGWEGAAASATVVYPGFLTVSVIVLQEKQQLFTKQLKHSSSGIKPNN